MLEIRTNDDGDWIEVISLGRYSEQTLFSGHSIGIYDLKQLLEYSSKDEVSLITNYEFK